MKKKLSERAKMRIRIAKDVLLQLKERKLKPAHLYADFSGKKSIEDLKPGTDLQPLFKEKNCQVCAIGALFVAKVRRYNDAQTTTYAFDQKYSDFIGNAFIHKNLRNIFSKNQLNDMEAAYESQLTYMTDKERMTWIMKNIIENGGTFRP